MVRDASGGAVRRAYYTMESAGGFADLHLRIPRFQRPVVWDAERQRSYVQAVYDNRILTTPIVWWCPPGCSPRTHILLDGLQRLTALDIPMTRDDGQEQDRSAVVIDVHTHLAVVGVAPDPAAGIFSSRTLASLAPLFEVLRALPRGSAVVDAAIAASERFRWGRLHVLEIEGSAADAFEAMRGVNAPGVIYDLDELEANIAATAAEWGVTP